MAVLQLSTVLLLYFSLVVAAAEQKPITLESWRALRSYPVSLLETVNSAERNATIKLYPASSYDPYHNSYAFFAFQGGDGCHSREVNNVSIAPDTCLTGNYSPQRNIKITKTAVCPSGEVPTFMYYHNGGCTGEPKYISLASRDILYSCLWSNSDTKHWSLIFRCDDLPKTTQGAANHMDAILPVAVGSDEPQDAIVAYRLRPDCQRTMSDNAFIGVPADVCLTTPDYAIQVYDPAFCANGTRALLARFEDPNCGAGSQKPSSKFGLVNLYDRDLNLCIPTGPKSQGDKESSQSLMFWCDGFGSVEPEIVLPPKLLPEKPSLFELGRKKKYWENRPNDNIQPDLDTCVNRNFSQVQVWSTGVCPDGSFPDMAFYYPSDCKGIPYLTKSSLHMWKEGDLHYIMGEMEGTSSFAFLCEGLDTQVDSDEVPVSLTLSASIIS